MKKPNDDGDIVLTKLEYESMVRLVHIVIDYFQMNGNMSSVAKKHDLSRERVRQLLAEYNLKGTGFIDHTSRVGEVRDCLFKHKGDVVLASRELGISTWTICAMRNKFFPELKKEDPISDDVIRAAYEKHEGNARAIAKELNIHPGTIYNRLTKVGLSARGNKKLSDEDLCKLIDEHSADVKKIAKACKMSPAAIYMRIKNLNN